MADQKEISSFPKILVIIAALLAFSVVMLGAYTRLTHAGLGCPDWPGCYGHMVLPDNYLGSALDNRKAWTEMIHRYLAGTLGFLIMVLGLTLLYRRPKSFSLKLPILLIILVIAQAMLGMWTVTLKLLPVVVMSHLLGGILIFSLLCCLALRLWSVQSLSSAEWRRPVIAGMLIVFLQIALGGWVSANYAGISCVGFPQCNGQWLPEWHFSTGFNLFSPAGLNYQGGLLESADRVSIQMVHRLGALLTFIYILSLSILIYLREKNKSLRLLAAAAGILVITQVSLGILNVTKLLPIKVAVAHNGVAALLMAVMLMMFYLCKQKKETH